MRGFSAADQEASTGTKLLLIVVKNFKDVDNCCIPGSYFFNDFTVLHVVVN